MNDLRYAIQMLYGLRTSGPNSWIAFCPVHEDPPTGHRRSLSITIAGDGKLLIYCHGGCEYRNIAAAMGIGEGSVTAPIQRPYPRPDRRPIDWQSIMTRYAVGTEPMALHGLCYSLGLSALNLGRLEASWAAPYDAWAFPMRTPDGEMIGIRLRNEAGEKWAVNGSRNGLFIPDGLISDALDTLLVCEGPTTCAALLDLDFYAVGRASCVGQEGLVGEVAYRRDVVIMADRDEVKLMPDGKPFSPGLAGAQRLAQRLDGEARSVKIVMPLMGKDFRDWFQAGATHEAVTTVIRNAKYWRPA